MCRVHDVRDIKKDSSEYIRITYSELDWYDKEQTKLELQMNVSMNMKEFRSSFECYINTYQRTFPWIEYRKNGV